MPFSVTNVQAILHEGLARPTQYQVFIAGPHVHSDKNMMLLCEGAEFPGKGFQTTQQTMFGIQLKLPYNFFYDDLTLTFAVGANMMVKKWFDLWQARICDPGNYYFSYFDEYKADIEIYQFDELKRHTYMAIAEDAWPSRIQALPLSYGQSNEYHKLSVTFAYRRWRNFRQMHENNKPGNFTGRDGGNLDPPLSGDAVSRQPPMKSPGVDPISDSNANFFMNKIFNGETE